MHKVNRMKTSSVKLRRVFGNIFVFSLLSFFSSLTGELNKYFKFCPEENLFSLYIQLIWLCVRNASNSRAMYSRKWISEIVNTECFIVL